MASLAEICLRPRREDRPTMKGVGMKLQVLRAMIKSQPNAQPYNKDVETLLPSRQSILIHLIIVRLLVAIQWSKNLLLGQICLAKGRTALPPITGAALRQWPTQPPNTDRRLSPFPVSCGKLRLQDFHGTKRSVFPDEVYEA
uniref:Uncharacterized protein n=1 Tax=Oryza glumipatula TaxID=40148 RepID=A0A0D9Y8G8_9ORYZ